MEGTQETRSDLPEQVIKPYRKRGRDLITGGQDDLEEDQVAQKRGFSFNGLNSDSKAAYLERCKLLPYQHHLQQEFFAESVVQTIAINTKFLVRLGFDAYNDIWKIFIKRPNFGGKPSIVTMLLVEAKQFVDYVNNELLPSIDNGIMTGIVPFRSENDARPNTQQFWEEDDVYVVPSGTFRMRTLHKMGKVFMNYLNTPVYTSVYNNFFGPRVILSRPELELLIKVIEQILDSIPPAEEI